MSKFKLGGIPSHARDLFYALRDKVTAANGERWSLALAALLKQLDPDSAIAALGEQEKYPLYSMVINGKTSFMTLREAGVAYDNGMVRVEIGGLVLESSRSAREITHEERAKISEIAEEYSASK